MFVTEAVLRSHRVVTPDWSGIKEAIESLRNEDVFLKGAGHASMTISGGSSGYHLEATLDGNFFHCLLADRNAQGTVSLVVGGQRINMEQRKVTGLGPVIVAAKSFAEDGVLDGSLQWEVCG